MTVKDVTKDPDALTLTVTAEFDAPVERIWQVWADPRQLERWWGPPGWPATFTHHDLRPDGSVHYFMTGPDGDKPAGLWQVLEVEPPRRLVIEDSFADDSGVADPNMPSSTAEVTIEATDAGGSRMLVVTRFPSSKAMEELLAMGAEEGFRAAMNQIDDVLAEPIA